MRLPSSFVFYALVDIAIRFFDTDLSLLIRLSVIEVQRKEVVTVTGLRYSCKTLKTSKVNDIIILMKRDNLHLTLTIDFKGSMLARKSSPTEKALPSLGNGLRQNCTIGIGIGQYKPSGLRD